MKAFLTAKQSFGLDINLNGIRAMALKQSKNCRQVVGFGSIELNANRVIASLEQDDGFLEAKIQELLTERFIGSIPSPYVTVSIPSAKTFSQSISLPAKAEKNIDNIINLEIEQYIPMPKDLLEIDWEIVERHDEMLEIALSAAPKIMVERVITALRSLKLEPILIEPSANSIARMLEGSEEGELATLIIDLGLTNTDFAVLDQAIKVTSNLTMGGNDFTLEISRKLNISLEKAYQLKVLKGFLKGRQQASITQALTPYMNRIEREAEKIIRYNSERLQGREIEQVLLVGTGSNLAGIAEYLTNSLLLPVRIASPWQSINFDSLDRPRRSSINRYLTVAGVASLDIKQVLG